MEETRMKDLVEQLNKANVAYYNGEEIMSNKEWDQLFDELKNLEESTGIILSESPTQHVGAPIIKGLTESIHEFPALSLDKTKDMYSYVNMFEKLMRPTNRNVVLMWKMDGSTVQATYENGRLQKLVTRGDGETGHLITHNAHNIHGLPINIPYTGKLVVRGEVVMSYHEFDRIQMEEGGIYKNARNLANATVSMLDSYEMSKREVYFKGFNLVYVEMLTELSSFNDRLTWMKGQGFEMVDYERCNIADLQKVMQRWTDNVSLFAYPVDGLVTAADDAVYADTLEGTNHHPNQMRGYAFKWEDKEKTTTLRQIEWSPSVNSLNPVAVFDPVELEGTIVTRAALHNVTYLLRKDLHVGNQITVYKANMIIPQVAKNLDYVGNELASDEIWTHYDIPRKCPVCGAATILQETGDDRTQTLVLACTNPDCAAKKLKRFNRFVQKGCMNIKGISEETIAKFISRGFIKEFADFYKLADHKAEIVSMDGFGETMFSNLVAAVETSRKTDFVSLINALGIPNIGKGQAKVLLKAYAGDIGSFFHDVYARHSFSTIDGIGDVLESNLWDWGNEYLRYIEWEDDDAFPEGINLEIYHLLQEVEIAQTNGNVAATLSRKTFVITGKLNHFANREALVEKIEALGGKVSGSVSAKTSYLVNNDVTSTSGKNKKAKELGIPIISEEELLSMLKEENA
jgi:DNA ligase (NAD+)